MIIIFYERFVSRGGWWVVAQVIAFGAILWALTKNRDPATWLSVTGWLVVVLAVMLGGSGMWMIRRKITPMPAPLTGATLMDTGPFGLVRHPIYGGVILFFLGASIKGGNILAGALSLALIPFFYAKSQHEERMLADHFPEYADYRRRVRRRIVPWLL